MTNECRPQSVDGAPGGGGAGEQEQMKASDDEAILDIISAAGHVALFSR